MIFYPWKMYAEYEDGSGLYFCGNDEDDCMCKIIEAIEKHGEVTYYTGVNDEDYANGEYIGRDNFIYD